MNCQPQCFPNNHAVHGWWPSAGRVYIICSGQNYISRRVSNQWVAPSVRKAALIGCKKQRNLFHFLTTCLIRRSYCMNIAKNTVKEFASGAISWIWSLHYDVRVYAHKPHVPLITSSWVDKSWTQHEDRDAPITCKTDLNLTGLRTEGN